MEKVKESDAAAAAKAAEAIKAADATDATADTTGVADGAEQSAETTGVADETKAEEQKEMIACDGEGCHFNVCDIEGHCHLELCDEEGGHCKFESDEKLFENFEEATPTKDEEGFSSFDPG